MSRFLINPKFFNHYHCNEKIKLLSKLYPTGFNHQYNLIINFVKKWILSITGENYFNNVYVDQSMTYKKMKRKSQLELLKHRNPQISIVHRYDNSFNRENIDLYQKGLNTLLVNRVDESFIRDFENNNFIGVRYRQIKIDFDIKIKTSSRMEQMDLYEKLKLGMKNGSTQDIYTSSTIQVPFELINNMYFTIHNKYIIQDDINSISEALEYINSHSLIPIIYDLDKGTGKYQFYIIVDKYNHRISFLDEMSFDDGEPDGDTYTDFMIDFNFSIYATAPLFFYHIYSDKSNVNTYYMNHVDNIINNNYSTTVDNNYNLLEFPNINERGFQIYIQSKLTEVPAGDLKINFNDIYNGVELSDNIRSVYLYCIDRKINPEIFLDIKFLYLGKYLNVETDWFNDNIIVKDIPNLSDLDILIYLDTNFINKTMIELNMSNFRNE